jgi:hypothetical protein
MSDDFVFYVYDDDPEDPRFSFWLETGDGGMSLYERPPDGEGMWLDPEPGSDYGQVEPSDELRGVVHDLIREGVDTERVAELPAHERHFVQVISGTIEEAEDRIPSPVWHWIHRCEPRGEAA